MAEGRTLRDMLGREGGLYEDPDAWIQSRPEIPGAPASVLGIGRGPRERVGWMPEPTPLELLDELGDPAPSTGAFIAVAPGPGLAQVGAEALGSLTGAPPRATLLTLLVGPRVSGRQPTQVVDTARASRVATFTAPLVGFSIWIGDSGVQVGQGLQLPAGLPYDIVIPGYQEVFAITDAPTLLPLKVQTAPLLIGDRERRY